jgi:C1A family cysteine protease
VLEQNKLDSVAHIQNEIMHNGPVTCGVHAEALLNYTTGIVTEWTGGTTDDHALELIGWGTENNVPYWIGQNNWGTFWGEDGFFRIIRGEDLAGIETGCTVFVLHHGFRHVTWIRLQSYDRCRIWTGCTIAAECPVLVVLQCLDAIHSANR